MLKALIGRYNYIHSNIVQIKVNEKDYESIELEKLKSQGYISEYSLVELYSDYYWRCRITQKLIDEACAPKITAQSKPATNQAAPKHENDMNKKIGYGLLATAAFIAFTVVFISVVSYGRVYFFDGYEITAFAWIAVFSCAAGGLVALISDSQAWVAALVVVAIVTFIVADTSGSGSGSGSKRGNCNNCGGDGWDSANSCSCVWCGGDGYTSWNP